MGGQVVPSVSIANLVQQRAAVMERMRQAALLVAEAATIAEAGHLGMPRLTLSRGFGRGASGTEISRARIRPGRDGTPHEIDPATSADIDREIRLGVDAAAWQFLMHESGLRTFMDAEARRKWDEAINEGNVPELTEGNVLATFEQLHAQRGDLFERGVIACFKRLSWHYKTNMPQKFGKRIVITFLRSQVSGPGKKWGSTTLGHPNYDRCSVLDDLSRVFHVLDEKPEPDHRQGWYARLGRRDAVDAIVEDDYLSVRSFRNGNGHVTFKRLELVDRLNKVVAKHYPGALPAPRGA